MARTAGPLASELFIPVLIVNPITQFLIDCVKQAIVIPSLCAVTSNLDAITN
jgi:hypothetical protein